LSGDFERPDLDRLCHELRHSRGYPAGSSVAVDLGGIGKVEVAPLACLVASLRGLSRRGVCDPLGSFTPPADGAAPACLRREELAQLVTESGCCWQTIGEPASLLGCESFATDDEIERVISNLRTRIASDTDWPDADLTSLGSMASDLAMNVLQHSDAQGGVVVSEIHPSEKRVSLAIADCGIGIRESLGRNPDYRDIPDDLVAIATALAPQTTAEPGQGGGMGLYLARLVVGENGGTFYVRSGDAARTQGETTIDESHLPHLAGLLIAVEARTDQEFDYGQIEKWLKEPSGIAG